jgi:hypothetical protein
MVHFAGYHPAARYIPVDEYCCGAAYTPPWTVSQCVSTEVPDRLCRQYMKIRKIEEHTEHPVISVRAVRVSFGRPSRANAPSIAPRHCPICPRCPMLSPDTSDASDTSDGTLQPTSW